MMASKSMAPNLDGLDECKTSSVRLAVPRQTEIVRCIQESRPDQDVERELWSRGEVLRIPMMMAMGCTS